MPSPLHKRQRAVTEVLLVYIATIGLIVGLYQLRGIPLVNSYLWTLAMLLQVYVPAWILQRQGLPLSTFGLHTKHIRKNVQLWLLCCAITIVPVLIGHHLWQSFNKHQFSAENGSYRQFSFDMRGTPPPSRDHNEVQVYVKQQEPVIIIQWRAALQGYLVSDKPMTVISGSQWILGKQRAKRIKLSGGGINSDINVQVRVKGRFLRFALKRDGQPLPAYFLRFGPQRETKKKPILERGLSWLLYLLVAQLLMVALPEELFYRGYVQTRLDDAFPLRYVWGIPLSWSNLITSILFALTHYFIGFEPHRLSVFFPSLVFGALKHRTNSLLAPILFHAFSNILIKLLEVWYL